VNTGDYCREYNHDINDPLSQEGASPDHSPLAMHTRVGFPSRMYGGLQTWVATDPKCVPALKLMSPFLGGSRRPQSMPE